MPREAPPRNMLSRYGVGTTRSDAHGNETMTHSIYTIFLPTHNAVYMIKYFRGHLAAWRSSVAGGTRRGALAKLWYHDHSRLTSHTKMVNAVLLKSHT